MRQACRMRNWGGLVWTLRAACMRLSPEVPSVKARGTAALLTYGSEERGH